ncbi:FtsX-like permease family protein [Psychrobacillus insolitus]|uniref:FtsX-like permease family protein n=2 Tax=Psychrobacillus insolitus TaxID=1461 RepID=A0A2W7MDF6_9BACI|nr:FtsX-like permease family protein [Psychrobacillus insolitus]
MAMTLNQLVLRSMRKNIKNYYLYVFALVFSVTLYYSFVTLQYNPAIVKEIGSGMSSAALKAGSYLLLFIVIFFVLYANKLFMNRRSKEIGLYQLVGMSKGLVTRLIAIENIILWLGSIILGVLMGFVTSRVFAMILLKILEKDAFVELTFSLEALLMTVIVFLLLLIVVILQTAIRIRRVSLLTLITTTGVADEKVKKFNAFHMFLGFIGLAFIGYGYYLSTSLLDLSNPDLTPNMLLFKMVSILILTVGGTYFVFRFSVAFILNLVRKSKKGLMSVQDVLSLSTIMHRMKSSAMSLTTITILSATTLGILTLSYISYYSVDTVAEEAIPYDYVMYEDTGFDLIEEFDKEEIQYTRDDIDLLAVEADVRSLLVKDAALNNDISTRLTIQVVSQKDIQSKLPNLQLKEGQGYIVGYDSLRAENIRIEAQKPIQFITSTGTEEVFITEVSEEYMVPNYHSYGFFTVVLEDSYFQKLLNDPLNENQMVVGMELQEVSQLKKAEKIFEANKVSVEIPYPSGIATKTVSVESQESYRLDLLNELGLTIFITGFLGLAFLITTGSILYFKQMSEADEEKATYTILRKIGFTTNEIMKGIHRKQLFNFGFPLAIGLAHSYFAVKSGWVFFGTELVAPLLITMGVYIILYSIFAILSAGYYRKVVEDAL